MPRRGRLELEPPKNAEEARAQGYTIYPGSKTDATGAGTAAHSKDRWSAEKKTEPKSDE